MSRTELRWDGDVALLTMTHADNRFHPDFLAEVHLALDEVEAKDGPAGVVITGTGKFFSNGLDLEYMGGLPQEEIPGVVADVQRLLARILGFPAVTVAALNGHAFAAGAMLAMTADQRVMRGDRGYFSLPEADLGMGFTPGMTALLAARLSSRVAHRAMVTAHRYTAEEAQADGVVDAVVPEDRVVAEAVERAAALAGKPRTAVKSIKRSLYGPVIDLLEAGEMPAPL